MNKLINFGAWLLAGFIISWAFEASIEQNAPKDGQSDIISSFVSNDENVKAMLEDNGIPKVILTMHNLEANVKIGDTFAITLTESDPNFKWMYEMDDDEAFENVNYDFLSYDETQRTWAFKTKKDGEHYLYFKQYNTKSNELLKNSDLTFKININE
ncbi:MAG TPA: hypothetical protein DCP90_04040 [Clostridiales bacterium]|nr:MAG: hypothetical protein A2Y22_07275 [Clostridiales bacterium GWD2_32_59]HAN09766.1 hypothetical protein [Clostridiales bacterium]